MILQVSSNKRSFRTVQFKPGLNVVLADRHKEATHQDSRNGLGKSTLVEIIHFCLGADTRPGKGLLVEDLQDWQFSLDLLLEGREIRVTRGTDEPRRVFIDGDTRGWPISPKTDAHRKNPSFDIKDWNTLLGHLMFGLPHTREKYAPSFRSLISYFIRRGRNGYLSPFTNFSKQSEVDKQVSVSFLLNLAWEDARAIQLLKDRKKGFSNLRQAVKSGVLESFGDSQGNLETKLIHLEEQANIQRTQLESFKVHPQYREIEQRANQLTSDIHALSDYNFNNRRLVDLYEKDLTQESAPTADHVHRVYAEAGVLLSDNALRRLEDVEAFHRTVVANRHDFLAQEIIRLRDEIDSNEERIAKITQERAELLEVLKTHGALEEYTHLQKLHLDAITRVKEVASLIENMRRLKKSTSQLKMEHELLQARAHTDYEERAETRARAVSLFNANSDFLYQAPGKFVIDFLPRGYRFDVAIERSGSDGIENMKIFCFDLMLSQLWARRTPSPRLLVHDSRLFDGVDERQKSLALMLSQPPLSRWGR